MFSFPTEYLGILGLALGLLALFNRYRDGDYTKEKMEAAKYAATHPDFEKMSALSRWWWHSYIREVYVVRAGGRFWRCLIPWIGVFCSVLAVVWFVSSMDTAHLNPLVSLQELTERRGKLIEFVPKKKGSSQATFLMEDGSVMTFGNRFMVGEVIEEAKQKSVRLWTRKGSGFDEGQERLEFVLADDRADATKAYKKRYDRIKRLEANIIPNLLLSLKFLLFFLGLIWLINIRPLKNQNQSTHQKG